MPTPFRHDFGRDEVAAIYRRPLLELVFDAQATHRRHQPRNEVQCAALLSIKTGGCPEDCGYCPQSAHFETDVKREPLLAVGDVLRAAHDAREAGASRFCLGAAYRNVPDGEPFERILEMVRGIRAEGMEACVTLGMLRPDQAVRLAAAGLTAYNHNLDTSERHYDKVVTTRTYDDRRRTRRARPRCPSPRPKARGCVWRTGPASSTRFRPGGRRSTGTGIRRSSRRSHTRPRRSTTCSSQARRMRPQSRWPSA